MDKPPAPPEYNPPQEKISKRPLTKNKPWGLLLGFYSISSQFAEKDLETTALCLKFYFINGNFYQLKF